MKTQLQTALRQLSPKSVDYATQFVLELQRSAHQLGCSDLHLQPTPQGIEVLWRIDGVLEQVGVFPRGEAADVVTRVKVLAGLLTYRQDIPQEGRIAARELGTIHEVEMRVATLPTIHGERVVIRRFLESYSPLVIDELGLVPTISGQLKGWTRETSGAVLIVGPVGSGKTTTAYACLRHIVAESNRGRSIVSLEDPVEVSLDGVVQSQANPTAGYDLSVGLKSLMRQDPEVLFVGEMRDRPTVELAFQAAMTGQLMITTFHATSATEAIHRLGEFGLERYAIKNSLLGIIAQRLLRKLCPCARWADITTDDNLGVGETRWKIAVGCDDCRGTGYAGRLLIAETLETRHPTMSESILNSTATNQLDAAAESSGMTSLWNTACQLVRDGVTSPTEIRRVFGLRHELEHGHGAEHRQVHG